MNNPEPLSSEQIITLSALFVSSSLMFYISFKTIYAMYERKTREDVLEPQQICLIEYQKWDSGKKSDFVSRVVSQIHSSIALCFAIKALFFTCIDPAYPGQYSNFFVSNYCLMDHYDFWQMISLALTCGYFAYDAYICYFHIKEKSTLMTQTYIHHFFCITGLFFAIVYGRGGALIIGNILLMNEVSTIFLNYRQFLLIFKKSKSKLYTWNAVLFFFTFLFCRIVLNTTTIYWVVKAFYYTVQDTPFFQLPIWQQTIGLYLISLFVAMNVLNYIWFIGIVKHLLRALKSNEGGDDDFKKQHDKEIIDNGPNYQAVNENDDEDLKKPMKV